MNVKKSSFKKCTLKGTKNGIVCGKSSLETVVFQNIGAMLGLCRVFQANAGLTSNFGRPSPTASTVCPSPPSSTRRSSAVTEVCVHLAVRFLQRSSDVLRCVCSALPTGLSPDLQSMEQIRRIMRPTDVPDTGAVHQSRENCVCVRDVSAHVCVFQACCVICCGQTRIKTCRAGVRTTGACPSRSEPMLSASSSTVMTWTSSAELTR